MYFYSANVSDFVNPFLLNNVINNQQWSKSLGNNKMKIKLLFKEIYSHQDFDLIVKVSECSFMNTGFGYQHKEKENKIKGQS